MRRGHGFPPLHIGAFVRLAFESFGKQADRLHSALRRRALGAYAAQLRHRTRDLAVASLPRRRDEAICRKLRPTIVNLLFARIPDQGQCLPDGKAWQTLRSYGVYDRP